MNGLSSWASTPTHTPRQRQREEREEKRAGWGGGRYDRFPFAHTLGVLEEINDQWKPLNAAPSCPSPAVPQYLSLTSPPLLCLDGSILPLHSPLPSPSRPTLTLPITDGPPVVQLLLAVAWRLALLWPWTYIIHRSMTLTVCACVNAALFPHSHCDQHGAIWLLAALLWRPTLISFISPIAQCCSSHTDWWSTEAVVGRPGCQTGQLTLARGPAARLCFLTDWIANCSSAVCFPSDIPTHGGGRLSCKWGEKKR